MKQLTRHSDILVAVGAVVIVLMMIVPVPRWALDLLLVFNIAFTLAVLLVSVYTRDPLEFAVFPALLLVATLFRLALSISATRLILLHAEAGAVIAAFGSFVVGGNYIVGIVVFLIIVIIQFVVVTNGAQRVAEVAARFTLDAMPGKQMAIDADLNSGLIDENEARARRKAISQEADFYGAMDGASKFVRGDAIAAIIVILINILGGFVIGITQKGMDLVTALQTFTLLTIGEGLVIQIPALLLSTAAGLVVTRAASESHLGDDLATQILAQPRAIAIAAAMLLIFAVMPGLPKLPFLAAAAIVGGIAYTVRTARRPLSEAGRAKARLEPEDMTSLLAVDPLELEIGYGLIALADPGQGGDLLERITAVRRQMALDLGIVVPPLRVRDNMQLKPNSYAIKLRGVELARGEIYPKHMLAMNPGTAARALRGIETREPAFGLPALWISDADRIEAEVAGYTVVDTSTVLVTHLSELIKQHAWEMLTRQDVRNLLDNLRAHSPALVEELVPELMNVGEVQNVLQGLLRERVSIRDLGTILEALADHARVTKDTDALVEVARRALARGITRQHLGADGALHAFVLDPGVEDAIMTSLRQTPAGNEIALQPETALHILERTRDQAQRSASEGYQPVALCSPAARPWFRRLVEPALPSLVVLSHAEIAAGIEVKSLGTVTLNEAAKV
jgi:flagellar biosynthesis protein FlhA